MSFKELMQKRRSIRFYEQKEVPLEDLLKLIDTARLSASAANLQQLRYQIIHTPELVEKVFACTRYAGKVHPRRSPVWGVNSPVAFIAVIAEGTVATHVWADAGAAIQSLLCQAAELDLGTCWIGAFDAKECPRILELSEGNTLLYLVAVGYPAEEPVVEDIEKGEDPSYYLDDKDVLHVPKYTVKAITTKR